MRLCLRLLEKRCAETAAVEVLVDVEMGERTLADGGEPYKGVTLDAQGNLYGTAAYGAVAVGMSDGSASSSVSCHSPPAARYELANFS